MNVLIINGFPDQTKFLEIFEDFVKQIKKVRRFINRYKNKQQTLIISYYYYLNFLHLYIYIFSSLQLFKKYADIQGIDKIQYFIRDYNNIDDFMIIDSDVENSRKVY